MNCISSIFLLNNLETGKYIGNIIQASYLRFEGGQVTIPQANGYPENTKHLEPKKYAPRSFLILSYPEI